MLRISLNVKVFLLSLDMRYDSVLLVQCLGVDCLLT